MAPRRHSDPPIYKDAQQDVEDRVDDLLPRLSLRQKLAQLTGVPAADLLADGAFDATASLPRLEQGVGYVVGIGGSCDLPPAASAAVANQVQQTLIERTAHGIPAIVLEDALAGYAAPDATLFPQAIGQAASFDVALVRDMGQQVQAQLRAVGARQARAPVLDVARDARWGALEQTFGEDPYLCGRMGVAFVRGLQSADLQQGVAATARHFLGSGLPEGGLHQAPVQLGPRQLREVYAEPFAAAIRDANLAAVSSAAVSVDGVPCSGAPSLLRTLLRDDLKFEGVVLAADDAVEQLQRHHRVAVDAAQAGRMALLAGVDVELPGPIGYGAELEALAAEDPELETLIDAAVARVLALKFRLGLFEQPYVEVAGAAAAFGTAAAAELARSMAEAGIVLLENDGVLPLGSEQRIAVLGPAAADARLLLGDHHPVALAERGRTATDATAAVPAPMQLRARSDAVETPLAALELRLDVRYRRGCNLHGEASRADIDAAVTAARHADVAVVCVGGRSGATLAASSGAHRDASDLGLTGPQSALIDAVLDTGTPTVVAVFGGRAFDLSAFANRVNALLHCWLPGQAGGTAVARVLLGDVDPGGRLPVTLSRGAGQQPTYYGHRQGGGRSMGHGAYTDLSNKPLYAFGFGRSYTQFGYGDLLGPESADIFSVVVLSVEVTNTGERHGIEVVQLYLSDVVADVARPNRALVGFAKLHLDPGETHRVKFHLDVSQAAYFNQALAYVVDPGELRLMVGSSSQYIRSELTLLLGGERRELKQHQVVATQVVVEPMAVKGDPV